MIALGEAKRYVQKFLTALTPIEVALVVALGCVAAESVTARVPVHGLSNSAMDDSALRVIDTSTAPFRLGVVDPGWRVTSRRCGLVRTRRCAVCPERHFATVRIACA